MLSPVCLCLATCVRLDPLAFGRLLLNGIDITPNQPEPVTGQTIDYQCAEGYQLVDAANTSRVLTQTVTICMVSGNWSIIGVECMSE